MGFDIAGDHDGSGKGSGKGGGAGRNEMFFEMEGRKSSRAPEAVEFAAKPCIYKRR